MGKAKTANRRTSQRSSLKEETATKHENLDCDTIENKQRTNTNELEERLQRLENAYVSGSSDVLKFVFFFLMGVALTIVLYPRVTSTIRTINEKNEESFSEVNKAENEHGDMNDPKYPVINRSQENQSIEFKESEQKLSIENGLNNKRDSELMEEVEISSIKNNSNKHKTEPAVGKINHKENDTVRNDELIGEDSKKVDKNDAFLKYAKEANEIKINLQEDGPRKKQIELFSSALEHKEDTAQMHRSKREETVTTYSDKDLENKEDTDGIHKSRNGKTTKEQSSKIKSQEMEDPSHKTKSTKEIDSAVPQKIKDFVPTYQREVTPKKIFVDGRRIPPMELLPQKPNNSSVKVWLYEEFLSTEECDGLRRVHDKHVQEQSKHGPIICFDSVSTLRKHLENAGKSIKVTPRDFTQGTTCVNESFSMQLKEWLNGNWSYSTAFYPQESRFTSIFEQRVKQAMGLLPENGGKFQITSYPLGIGYKSHTDCTETEDKRDRVATVVVYLETVAKGGETAFPELGIWVRPRKGRAVMWNNMDANGHCEPMSIHVANKVEEGHKYILQRWYYYKSFYSLGKRPPEPTLPARHPGQPRVSCDEYEYGSCRWYDEWNFEHLIEYERQKYTLV